MSPAFFLAVTHASRPGSKSLLIGLLAALAAGALLAALSIASAIASNTEAFLTENYSGKVVVAAGDSAALFGYASITGNERQALLPSPDRVEEVARRVASPAGMKRLLVGYLSLVPGDRAEEEMAIAYGIGPEGIGFRNGEGRGQFPYALSPGSSFPGPGEILISESFAGRLAKAGGKPLGIGSLITAAALKDAGLGVKSLRVSGFYRYDGGVSELDRIVFLDGMTASRLLLDDAELAVSREGAGATDGGRSADDGGSPPPDDSFFESAAPVAEGEDAGAIQALGAEKGPREAKAPEGPDRQHEPGNNWHYLCLDLGPGRDAGAAIASLNAAFRKEGVGARAFSWSEASSGYASSSGLFRAIALGAIGAAAAFAILILANSLVILAESRTRTIGAIRAMGAGRGTVFGWICIEGLLAASLGAVAGAGASAAAMALVSSAALPVKSPAVRELFASATFAFPVRGPDILVAAAISIIASSPACLAAAARALRVEPAAAMRA